MADESKLHNQMERAERAEIALEELDAAMKALEADCFEVFKTSDIHDDNGRKMCRLYLRVLSDVHGRFARAVQTGKAAHTELLRLRGESKIKRFING